jgi:hypothetical protein
MTCRSCGSENQTQFVSEIMIHFAGLRNLDKPGALVFPKVLVCLDCGVSQFSLTQGELGLLKANIAA